MILDSFNPMYSNSATITDENIFKGTKVKINWAAKIEMITT